MTLSPALAFAVARLQTRRRTRRGRCPALILPTDASRLSDPVAAVARLPRVWARGAPSLAVIVREADARRRAALAVRLRPVCRARRILLLVANDPSLARSVHADGVHLSEAALVRRAIGVGASRSHGRHLITAAAHSLGALFLADRRRVDAALVSPVFPTLSHPGARPLGTLRFAALVHALRRRGRGMPIVALGGVTGANAARLDSAGAIGLAAIGSLS